MSLFGNYEDLDSSDDATVQCFNLQREGSVGAQEEWYKISGLLNAPNALLLIAISSRKLRKDQTFSF